MNDRIKREKIGEGVFFTAITDPKFKSNRISVNLLLPLEEETAANRAIVPFVLRLRYKDCPDFTQLNEKLCDLYGAIVDGDVRKYGAYQIINLSVQSLDDRYSIAGEPLVQECAGFGLRNAVRPLFGKRFVFRRRCLSGKGRISLTPLNRNLTINGNMPSTNAFR